MSLILSICVPTYNRCKELIRLLDSIPNDGDVEIVICDDGSSDDTKAMLDSSNIKSDRLQYIYQENQGRSVALKNAIMKARGEYIVVMDSDDWFTDDGVAQIKNTIDMFDEYDSFVFGVSLVRGDSVIKNIPPNVISEVNFISLRADERAKGDLKEVVKREHIHNNIYAVPEGCRRVPTYLLWSKIAEHINCKVVCEVVAVKEYLSGGMSDQILSLKTRNAQPMVELFELLSASNRYSSRRYRFRSMIQWGRYSFHLGKLNCKTLWNIAILPVSFVAYIYDLVILKFK